MTISANDVLFLSLCGLSGLLVLCAVISPKYIHHNRKGDRHA